MITYISQSRSHHSLLFLNIFFLHFYSLTARHQSISEEFILRPQRTNSEASDVRRDPKTD